MSRRGPDPTVIGIALAFAGMLLLTLTPVVGRWAEVPPTFALIALGSAILLIVVGAGLGLFAGREATGRSLHDGEGPDTRPPSR